jgi:hypothetical protein
MRETSMTVDDRTRLQLHRKLEEVLGTEEADTLMAHLPPVTWNEVATKDDVRAEGIATRNDLRRESAEFRTELQTEMAHLRTDLTVEMADLRTEMAHLRTGVTVEMAHLRTGLQTEMADLRSDVRVEFGQLRVEFGQLRGEFGQLRGELAAGVSDGRAQLDRSVNAQTWKLMTFTAAWSSMLVAVTALVR